jgi:hypothetical protein
MKKHKTAGDRLILMIARHKDNATLRTLAHSRMSGALLELARRETVGDVVFEQTYRNGRRSRSLTARLTAHGIWRAIRLTTGYDPALATATLAAADIKALLARLEAERNPLAVELAGYKEDAMAYRAQQKRSGALERRAWELIPKVQEILALPPRKISARKRAKLNRFLESHGLKPAAPIAEPSRTLLSPTYEVPGIRPRQDTAPAPLIRPTPVLQPTVGNQTEEPGLAKPSRAPREECIICEGGKYKDVLPAHDCTLNTRPLSMTPRAVRQQENAAAGDPTGSPIERIKAKAIRKGYGDAIKSNGILYDSRVIDFCDWDARIPD